MICASSVRSPQTDTGRAVPAVGGQFHDGGAAGRVDVDELVVDADRAELTAVSGGNPPLVAVTQVDMVPADQWPAGLQVRGGDRHRVAHPVGRDDLLTLPQSVVAVELA
jgi:hypothetical protein